MQSARPFTEMEKRFLRAIRDDIHSRPDFYEPGVRFILRQYSMRAQFLESSRHFQEARKVFGGTVSHPAPRRRRPTPLRILGPAFVGLEESGIGTPDDDLREFDADKAKAVIVLTWLLTDKDANQHALGRQFGRWKHEAGGREMVRWGTLDEDGRRERWMKLARHALRKLIRRGSPNTRPKKKRATRRTTKQRRPTEKQLEALMVVGECGQNFAEAARRLKLDPKSVRQRNSAGLRNAGKLASKLIGKPSTQSLEGKRGRTVVATDDDGSARPVGKRPVPRDQR